MTAPYYTDDAVTLYAGDCLDVLPTLPDNSVDAVVTDPPYGLEFMGKEWDSFRVDDPGTNRHRGERAGAQGTKGTTDQRWTGADGRSMPSSRVNYGGGKRPTTNQCTGCGKRDQFRNPHACPAGTAWESILLNPHAAPPSSLAFQQWCQLWAEQCLRVLKPGGHLLAFGGTRTWHRLACGIEDAGFEIRDNILAWLYGSGFPKSLDVSKAIDRAAGAEREITRIGEPVEYGGLGEDWTVGVHSSKRPRADAPATADAQRWQGWGTALKPGWEAVIHAQKPLSDKDFLARIGSWLAQAADPTTPTGAAVASNDQTATSPSGSATSMNSNTVTSWHNCWAELSEATSTSTTETTSRTTTDLRTLFSSLAQITPESITQDQKSPDGLLSPVELADNLFAAAVLNSRVTRTLTATESATRPTLRTSPAEVALSPIVVARKPLVGTVAANVLAHGTGALNIDGCRIEGEVPSVPRGTFAGSNNNWEMAGRNGTMSEPHPAGRWPANVALDETAAAALDHMSGEVGANSVGSDPAEYEHRNEVYGRFSSVRPFNHEGGKGGASRFFYTAKAGSDERITHDGVSHPTVKPLSLMRWLVRLVTPPGGVCLEPFAGSGTTVEAAILEGFRCIAIEREADYLPLITQRLNRRRDPIAYLTAAGEDLGLFDEEPA